MGASPWAYGLACLIGACTPTEAAKDPPAAPRTSPASSGTAASLSPAIASAAPIPIETAHTAPEAQIPDAHTYAWLGDRDPDLPEAVDSLVDRFPPPSGFRRVNVEASSFGAFTRGLPLAAPGTPVRSHRGAVILGPGDDRLAAVVAMDVGTGDLQQCADSIIRLHAEWLFSQGRRDMSYRAASGTPISFARYLEGDRVVPKGLSISFERRAKPTTPTHRTLRRFLDDVFSYANTVSLSREARPIDVSALEPGDFVVAPGSPGHAVMVLDLARSSDGHRVALLGQGYMPAQNFHVLRADKESPWFPVDEAAGALSTPFWQPFPWSTLRRLDGRR